MRVLFLGSSNDVGNFVQPEQKKHVLAASRLEADCGEPVEFFVKGIWPNSELPGYVERWMGESSPDVVYINTGSYWFLYRSVPLRVKRLLGRVGGESFGSAGARVARSERWAYNRAFRALRSFLQRTIGGDTNFTVEQVIERISECIRIAARAENAVVVVKGPQGKARYSASARGFRRDEANRLKLHTALERLCEQLHLTYDGVGEGGLRDTPEYRRKTAIGDGMHADERRHVFEAEALYASIRRGLVSAGRLEAS